MRPLFCFSALRHTLTLLFLFLIAFAQSASADAKYQTTADWGSGFNGQLVVTSAEALTNWTLEFDFNRSLTSVWDAHVASHIGTHYVLKSAGWNDSIAAGGQISFGFGGAPGNVAAGPTNIVLRGTTKPTPTPTVTPNPTATPNPTVTPSPTAKPVPTATPVPGTNSVSVTITQTSSWSGGFGTNIEIANGGTTAIDGWVLKFDFAPHIDSLWNGVMSAQGNTYTVKNESWDGSIAPGGKVTLGLSATGELDVASAGNAFLNGAPCDLKVVPGSSNPSPTNPSGNNIVIGGSVDANGEALQITIPSGASSFPLSLSQGGSGTFSVASNHPSVVAAQIVGGNLNLNGISAGRAGLRLQEAGGATRYIGVRVKTASGSLPGLPAYLSLGSVSEDTDDHLSFWHDFDSGAKGRYIDARYIYLNGGPTYGWTTWSNTPGGRAISYIRESKKMGAIPIFVWYNIPDGGESYFTDTEHIQSATYMRDYFKMLLLLLDVIKKESPDDPVGLILEPDFLGYLAQNAGKPASQIAAQTNAAYAAGALQAGIDPQFPDTVQGLVQAINYIIARDTPQSFFGWQMNLWASPAGGWTTPVPGKGLMHLTDDKDMVQGRVMIYNEAQAITQYYLDAGIASYGASLVSIDKYGLDAATAEASAAGDPANSTWFWNADQWNNYLVFVRAMHETSKLPVVLWQLPVGHINSSQQSNPYTGGLFPDLANRDRQGEDSAPTFFFGDTFVTTGKRFDHFSSNRAYDPSVSTSGDAIIWGEHMGAAAEAGVAMALFGAGVGGSTTNVGAPPSDSKWWITKAEGYLARPASGK